MRTNEKGFTLIELVVVIVILGILAATALPRFIDISDEAEQAATDGVAGAMGSAMAINFAARQVSPTAGQSVSNCNTWGILQGGQPNGYTIAGAAIAAGATTTCTVTRTGSSQTSDFIGMGVN